jgi:hypothetical protein
LSTQQPKKPAPALPPAARLEPLIGSLQTEHEKMLALAGQIRGALRTADADALRACLSEQALTMERIGDLERERASVVKAVGPITRTDPTRPVRLTDIASSLPEPERSRLVSAAARLKDTIARVLREQRTLGAAMGALAGHLEGVMRGVARSLNHAQTYSRRGSVDAASAAAGLDLRS